MLGALILDRIGKGSCETHGKRRRIRLELVVGLRPCLPAFDGDFDNEFSATDILLGPGDLRSNVILIEGRQFDVHAFGHNRSPLLSGAAADTDASRRRRRRLLHSDLTIEAVAARVIDVQVSGELCCHERPQLATFTAICHPRVFSARSASVSHLSAISMKSDLCREVRAASANRMQSAALLRNWAKMSKCASIP
jgi:hypothetical protein